MIYSGDLPSGQRLYLENKGDATIVTILMQQSGQQQQSSSSFVTGAWQSPPEILASAQGAIVRVMTASGLWSLMVQGMNLMVQTGAVTVGDDLKPIGLTVLSQMPQQSGTASFEMPPMQPMTSMQPMAPMQPMTMGNMNMNANPMQMQMGNMAMSMGRSDGAANPVASPINNASTTTKTAKFCSQCGAGLAEGARFCSSCGYQIS